jgi:hypothetical protein
MSVHRESNEKRVVIRQKFALDPLLLARPAAAECPYVRVGRIISSPPTQPFIGVIQHVVGGKLIEDSYQ